MVTFLNKLFAVQFLNSLPTVFAGLGAFASATEWISCMKFLEEILGEMFLIPSKIILTWK